MHRIATIPGGWNRDSEGVVFVEQTPAPIVFLTAADTDIQTLSAAINQLPEDFPEIRATNLLQLQQQLTIDNYAEDVLQHAQVIVVRLLGGRSYWDYGMEVVEATVEETGATLIVFPGDDGFDPTLISHSTVSVKTANTIWRYFQEGGIENFVWGLQLVADATWGSNYQSPAPQPVPQVGCYDVAAIPEQPVATAGILFYRAHYLSGNTAVIDALSQALAERNLHPVPIFVSSLRDREVRDAVTEIASDVSIILNTTGFSVAKLDAATPDLQFWQSLDVPVLQTILSGGTKEQWENQWQGLSPKDMAMNVALPEIDGRITSRAISFKNSTATDDRLQTQVVVYEPMPDRVAFVADLAANWCRLQKTPPPQRKIALILANYPNRDGRLANGVGLDTPASCVEILQALQEAGYHVENLPPDSETLMAWLTAGRTNDPEGFEMRAIDQYLSAEEYRNCWQNLPEEVQKGIANRWGLPPDNSLPIPGIQLGNIFIGIQPSRGYDNDPALSYHAPDLEPTHRYLAFYHWLQRYFEAQAIVHVGKHGNLEWLPGKSVALSKTCYPEVALGAIPHFYPFIVNDPGEGSQAKRRSQAVILDHLTPPMTRAQLYSSLQALENLVDEYYQAEGLDPSRLPVIRDRITSTIQEANLDKDLNLSGDFPEYLTQIDAYLCDLKEAQIRDGLHIFGKAPQGRQLRDLIVAIARYPGGGLGIIDAIAQDWGIEAEGRNNLEQLEAEAARLVDAVIASKDWQSQVAGEASQQVLQWIETTILPHLQQTSQEIANLLQGLSGRYVPSGVAGAPTRGRPEVLPTGRNFYSVDIRAIPTESAWEVGSKAAETLIERYTQENGEYPQTLGLSVWGTSTMRTGGDDIAEALALLGVRPVWEGVSRRVVDWEILPVSVLGRPRVDVTLRVSGFFRDAFPNLIDLFDRAAQAVAALPESAEENPLAAQVSSESQTWQQMGFPEDQARRRASYRVFGSKPGAYGAGLQGLIEGQNWQTDEDLARAYVNWSCYAYAGNNDGTAVAHASPEAFENRLQQMQVILHNQDNREHDLLDSDDYYQFQGGMTVAARSLQGQNPQTYFGDNSRPDTPRIRSLREQLHFVYRSRVVNPKWLQGVMRHGYKGAFEMSATVDYLFAYDATTQCAEDFMYEGVAQAYVLDEQVQDFVKKHNPWALRDMAERLLEANQRQMWSTAPPDMLEQLRAIALDAEASVEGKLTSSSESES